MIGWWVCCSRRLWLVRWWRARGASSACSACSLTLFMGCLSLFSFLPSHYLHHHISFFCFRCFLFASLRSSILLFLYVISVYHICFRSCSILHMTKCSRLFDLPWSILFHPPSVYPPLAHSLSFSHSSFAFSRKAIIVALTLWGRG